MRRKSYNCVVTKCTKCKMFQCTYSDLDYELSSPRHDQAQLTRSGLAASASRSRKIRVLTAAGEVSVSDMPLKFDQLQTR
jgi:hypothetical protein